MIVFVTHSAGIGGGETSFLNLFHEIHLTNKSNLILFKKGKLLEYVKELHRTDCHYKNWFDFLVYLLINRKEIESILFNDYFSLVIWGGFSRLIHIKVVWIGHGWWYKNIRVLPLLFFPHKIVCVSSAVKKYFDSYKALKRKTTLIPLGINVNAYRVENCQSNKNKYVVAIIGRYQRVKNHTLFLKIAKKLIETHQYNYEFHIVGSNTFEIAEDEHNYNKILSYVRNDIDLRSAVTFIPHMDNIQEYYFGIDFIVQPSQFESFGMVLVEAMASGKIVLATNQGGPNDIITHGIDGYLISPDNIDEYANTILSLTGNPGAYIHMAALARTKIVTNFNIKDIASKYKNILCL